MKRYLINKDFIPISFIESKAKNGSKGDKERLMILTSYCFNSSPFFI